MAYPVVSTYRLQLHAGFTFADAANLVDYLHDLGVSHLYLSPILTAAPGSEHGYDVTDPTTVSAELGGPDGLAALARAARNHGMGLIVDIVPNHVAVDAPQHNSWWWDVLAHGRQSTRAGFFDIDWEADPDGRILLPVLGSADDLKHLLLDGDRLRMGSLEFPVAPGSANDTTDARAVHDRQHYRLIPWRDGVCGYRRFFSVSGLAGLRQEDGAVFAETHAEVARWVADGLVDGVRIDHPDGLADPAGYLHRLRALLGPAAWIVIEKILAPGEPLDPALPVQGSTGYDVLREIGGVFVDPGGAVELTALADVAGFGYCDAPELLRQLKIQTITGTLRGELARLCRAIEAAAGRTHPRLSEAVAALLTDIGVYRCDYPALAQQLSEAISATVAREHELAAPLELVAAALTTGGDAGARLQQLCGAMTAKAVEDCYFYRDPRLVSLNEVGGAPWRFGVSAAEFHRSAQVRAEQWAHTMTTLSTHDTKRGEDVRARIGVLSQVPGLWAEMVGRWESLAPSPDPITGLFLWQNIFGVWPANSAGDLRARLHAYAEKATREAGLHTSWIDPNPNFEAAVHRWTDEVLDGPVAAELSALVHRLLPHAHSDALGQKLLALTVPGVPDVYQGTERWEDNLVDPDNRRPVDYAERRAELSRGEHPKLRVVRAALHARRRHSDTFLAAGYRPLLATGPSAAHLVAFGRGDNIVVAVSRWTVALEDTGWGDTELALPDGVWSDSLSGARRTGTVRVADVFAELPVALLERTDD